MLEFVQRTTKPNVIDVRAKCIYCIRNEWAEESEREREGASERGNSDRM